METPQTVRSIVQEMVANSNGLPVSVKMRLGVDSNESYEFAKSFIEEVSKAGCRRFIVHARKAWLSGVSPQRNRSLPPLLYDRVYRLACDFPDFDFTLNGGVKTVEEARRLLFSPEEHKQRGWEGENRLHGVMIGRAVMNSALCLAEADTLIYGAASNPSTAYSRRTVAEGYIKYLEELEINHSASPRSPSPQHVTFPSSVPQPLSGSGEEIISTDLGGIDVCGMRSAFPLLKPILCLFSGERGAKLFRQEIDRLIRERTAEGEMPSSILSETLDLLSSRHCEVLDKPLVHENYPPS
eukprot:GHVN01107001.1.p1 GENE.GHVN01107001.1~~GHVN01107001.1.p1  ORF type:complete len:317 (-),score=54.11 GHVN01107001.1:212-1102(-)